MKHALFLDCYGVLFVTPEVLLGEKFPESSSEITNLAKSRSFGYVSLQDFISEVDSITNLGEQAISSYFNNDLVLNENLVNAVRTNLLEYYDVYILSNTTQADLVRRSRMEVFHDLPVAGCYSSEMLGFMKPDKEIFYSAKRLLDRNYASMVLVDDLKSNVDGAVRAGWDGIVYADAIGTTEKLKELYYARVAGS